MSDDTERWLTPTEVAYRLGVSAKTVTRWAKAGKLASTTTLGGHRRFRLSDVRRVLDELTVDNAEGA